MMRQSSRRSFLLETAGKTALVPAAMAALRGPSPLRAAPPRDGPGEVEEYFRMVRRQFAFRENTVPIPPHRNRPVQDRQHGKTTPAREDPHSAHCGRILVDRQVTIERRTGVEGKEQRKDARPNVEDAGGRLCLGREDLLKRLERG